MTTITAVTANNKARVGMNDVVGTAQLVVGTVTGAVTGAVNGALTGTMTGDDWGAVGASCIVVVFVVGDSVMPVEAAMGAVVGMASVGCNTNLS